MSSSKKNQPVTVRLGDDDERIIREMGAKYNIESRSEILRFALRNLECEGKMDVLPKLCNVCSMVNEIVEKSDMSETERNNLREALNEAWNEL